MTAIEASAKVVEALASANIAATEAAAATETALGFARYSQVDGGAIIPELPADGPRVGAELVLVDADGHPYQVNVWNGEAWVKSQYLLDQALFLSPDGTIQIGNGVLVSPRIIGGDFVGNTFVGGLFTLPSVASETVVDSDTFEDGISMWVNADSGYSDPARSTAQAHTGSASLLLGRNGKQFGAHRILPFTSFPNGGYISMWVRRSSDGRVAIGSDNNGVQTPALIMGSTWTEVRRELAPNSTINGTWILGELPDTGGSVHIDSFRVVQYNHSAGLAAIDRDDAGRARIYSVDAAGNLSGLRDGRAYSLFKTNSSATFSSEIGPVPGGGLGTQGVQHVLSQTYSGFLGELKLQMSSTGTGYLVSTGTDRAQSLIEMAEDITLRGARIFLDAPVSFAGDTNWASIATPSGISGTVQWRRRADVIHLRFNVTTDAAVASDAAFAPAFTIPAAARAGVLSGSLVSFAAVVGGSGGATGSFTAAGVVSLRNLHTTAQSNFRGTASWPATA